MNALLRHLWGESPAQDRVWAQVTGLAAERAVRRLLMVLNFQAFIDESESQDEFVLGGHIATAEKWALLSKEWEELLPFASMDKHGKRRFKMSEMALTEEGMERAQAFHRLIENHVILSVSTRVNLADFKRAHEHVVSSLYYSMKVIPDFKMWKNPYFFAFRLLLDGFHNEREKFKKHLPLDQKIDFIFDERAEKRPILDAWEEYLEKRDEGRRELYGATPRFEDDRDFLPLQAADLWAWWVREWYEWENSPLPENMRNLDFFGRWRGKERPIVTWSPTEEEMIENLKKSCN